MTSHADVPVFDPVSSDFLADPYPVYARFRQQPAPVVRNGATQWVAARYQPVAALLKDPRLRNDFPPQVQQLKLGEGDACDFVVRSTLHQEDPHHALLRRFLGRVVHATPMEALRQRVVALVDELLAPALERGRLEVVADIAVPLPLAVACELVGIPAGDRAQVQRHGLEVVKAFTVAMPEHDRPSVNASVRWLRSYFAETALGQGRGGPAAGSPALAAALGELDGRVDRDMVVDNLVFLFVSGFTTTVHMISSLCAALLEHPDELGRLREDRSLVAGAVEELLRYDSPLQHVTRLVAERVDLDGVTLRPGRLVHLLIGAANHDESQFPDPSRFDVGRDPNPHLGFGGGRHSCLGAGLGRLEAGVVVERVLARCATFEPAGPAVRRPMQVFRTYQHVPARVRPA
jgi:cytochrome P450